MVPRIILASSHERPGHVDGRCPLDEAHALGHRVRRRDGEEHGHVSRQQVPLFTATLLVLGSRATDLPTMVPPFVGERLPTILRDQPYMRRAVPRGMAESLSVWHDTLPLGGTLSGSLEGVCCFDSRNCQTVGVPRQSRGFTLINYDKMFSVGISDICL